jgi:hypothetical protein
MPLIREKPAGPTVRHYHLFERFDTDDQKD